jgi:hypothetical protein
MEVDGGIVNLNQWYASAQKDDASPPILKA